MQTDAGTQAQGRSHDAEAVKVPSVTYSIDQMLMFEFQDNYLLLIALEGKSVQLFDCRNGHFLDELNFYDNVLSQLKQQNKEALLEREEKQKATQAAKNGEANPQRDEEEEEALSKAQEAQRRKQLREKGIFQCPLPPYREPVRVRLACSHKHRDHDDDHDHDHDHDDDHDHHSHDNEDQRTSNADEEHADGEEPCDGSDEGEEPSSGGRGRQEESQMNREESRRAQGEDLASIKEERSNQRGDSARELDHSEHK